MNNEMAYLLGMICGNGTVKRGATETIISIEIPHKKLWTEDFHDVALYVKASLNDIRSIIEPLTGAGLSTAQVKSATTLSFSKPNTDYITREIMRYTGSALHHTDMRIHQDIYSFTRDEKKQFLRGFCDVTGYIRRSNTAYGIKYNHRVYIEIPANWFMVIDISNILKSIDIPVQTIDWAHPNMRDGNLRKFNEGNPDFWKKEHQIKIYANEFLPIGFGVIHKQQALQEYSEELLTGYRADRGINASQITHRFYWKVPDRSKTARKQHPGENDIFIPEEIRGKHYTSWRQIAQDLGYGE